MSDQPAKDLRLLNRLAAVLGEIEKSDGLSWIVAAKEIRTRTTTLTYWRTLCMSQTRVMTKEQVEHARANFEKLGIPFS